MEEMFFRPLLRTYVLLSYLLFDTNFYGYKFILLLVNIGSIFLAYKVGKLYSNEKTGLIFALLFTFLNPIISTAFFSRAHQIFEVFFLLLSILFLKKISIDTNKTNMFLFILSSALAFLSRESSIVLIPLFLYFFPLDKKLKRKLLLYLIMIIVPLIFMNKFILIFLFFLLSSSIRIVYNSSLLPQDIFHNFLNPSIFLYFIILFIASYYFIRFRKNKELKAFAVLMLGSFSIPFSYFIFILLPTPMEYFASFLIPALFVISIRITQIKNKFFHYFVCLITIILVLFLVLFNILPNIMQLVLKHHSDNDNNWYYSFKEYEKKYKNLSLVEVDSSIFPIFPDNDIKSYRPKAPPNFDYKCNLRALSNITKIGENRILYFNEIGLKKPSSFYFITYPWMMNIIQLKQKIESLGYCEIYTNLYTRC